VEAALCRLAAMRAHMRRINLGEERDPAIARGVGMDERGLEAMYRLLALAKYEERYVIPTTYVTDGAGGAAGAGCSLDHEGGPGMYGPDAEAAGAFHAPPATPAGAAPGTGRESLRGRVNLLNWNGRGRPKGLFPEPPVQRGAAE
jgi:nitrate reductase beta subunit